MSRILKQTRATLFQSQLNWKVFYGFGAGHTLFWGATTAYALGFEENEHAKALTNSSVALTALGVVYLLLLNLRAGKYIKQVALIGDKVELVNLRLRNNVMLLDRKKLKVDGKFILNGKTRYEMASGLVLNQKLLNKL